MINADDYYRERSLRLVYNFINSDTHNPHLYCMADLFWVTPK